MSRSPKEHTSQGRFREVRSILRRYNRPQPTERDEAPENRLIFGSNAPLRAVIQKVKACYNWITSCTGRPRKTASPEVTEAVGEMENNISVPCDHLRPENRYEQELPIFDTDWSTRPTSLYTIDVPSSPSSSISQRQRRSSILHLSVDIYRTWWTLQGASPMEPSMMETIFGPVDEPRRRFNLRRRLARNRRGWS